MDPKFSLNFNSEHIFAYHLLSFFLTKNLDCDKASTYNTGVSYRIKGKELKYLRLNKVNKSDEKWF